MSPETRSTRFRYSILLLLILMYAISYIDRVGIAAVAPALSQDFGLSPSQLGAVFSAFSLSYALFQIPGGRLADVFGLLVEYTGMWQLPFLLTS